MYQHRDLSVSVHYLILTNHYHHLKDGETEAFRSYELEL